MTDSRTGSFPSLSLFLVRPKSRRLEVPVVVPAVAVVDLRREVAADLVIVDADVVVSVVLLVEEEVVSSPEVVLVVSVDEVVQGVVLLVGVVEVAIKHGLTVRRRCQNSGLAQFNGFGVLASDCGQGWVLSQMVSWYGIVYLCDGCTMERRFHSTCQPRQ